MTHIGQDFGTALAKQKYPAPGDERWRLAYECGAKGAEIDRLRHALEVVLDYAKDREDADCAGDPPSYRPNAWMQVAQIVREALKP